MTNIVVGRPLSNMPNQYLNGLAIAWISNTSISVSNGEARDNTNVADIVLYNSGLITLINAATNGANGLDTGSLAASTFYYVHVIGSSLSPIPTIYEDTQVSTLASGTVVLNGTVISEGSVTGPATTENNVYPVATLLSLSSTAPTLPEGYDMFRRVGAVLTDGSAHFLNFWQTSGNSNVRWMYYDIAIQVLNAGSSGTYAAISLATAVPTIAAEGTNANVMFDVILTPAAAGDTVNFRPTGSSSTNGNAIMSGDVISQAHEDSIQVIAAISSSNLSVDYKVTGTATVNVTGYQDYL